MIVLMDQAFKYSGHALKKGCFHGTHRRLQSGQSIPVTLPDGNGGPVDLDALGGIGLDPAYADDKGPVHPYKEMGGQQGLDLMGAHLRDIFILRGGDLYIFPLALDINDV